MLPFQIEDASQRVENQADEEGEEAKKDQTQAKKEEVKGEKEKVHAVVKQDVRLNNRIIDLRVPANQALMRL